MTVIRRLRRPVLFGLLTTQFLLLHPRWAATQNTNSTSWVKIIQNASPGIVVIETDTSLGSGFLVNSNGTVVTNHHVIADAKEITIRLSNGEAYRRVYLLSEDESRDIAILRIEASDVPTLKLGNSNQTKVGEEVLLIGAPRGLDQTVSNGIISGIRTLDEGTRVIQTTAPASPGSSGGPLLDRAGNVIGILTFSVVAGQNLNFAIPINYAKGMLDTLSLAAAVAPLTVLDSTKSKSIRTSETIKPVVVQEPLRPVVGEAYAKCILDLKEIAIFLKPNSSDCCAAVISCYERVGVIETLVPWVHVRTKDNKEGYVHSMFLGEVR